MTSLNMMSLNLVLIQHYICTPCSCLYSRFSEHTHIMCTDIMYTHTLAGMHVGNIIYIV